MKVLMTGGGTGGHVYPAIAIANTIKQKINKELEDLNNTVKNINLIDIYRTLHLKRQNRYSWQVHTEHSPS